MSGLSKEKIVELKGSGKDWDMYVDGNFVSEAMSRSGSKFKFSSWSGSRSGHRCWSGSYIIESNGPQEMPKWLKDEEKKNS